MNLLIVDDEILAIQGLVDDLPWEELRFDEIFVATSYAQAVNHFRTKAIDILLCDIEMPLRSGLELVRWVKENYPKVQCVFLTCHDEFLFAKKAIDLECVGYVLKPADTMEVVEILLKARKKCEQSMNQGQPGMNTDYNPEEEEGNGTRNAVERVETYIRLHLSNSLSVEELAGIAHLSPTHLSRLFKKKHNRTLVDYITEQRILAARKYLEENRLSVSAVASKTGYNNYSYFTKAFKKVTGMTPREYRQKISFADGLSSDIEEE